MINPGRHDADSASVAAVTNQGRLLVFALKDLPELTKGKGNKLLNVPSAAFRASEEELIGAVVVGEKDELLVHAGQRHLHQSQRLKLCRRASPPRTSPTRGFQKVDRLSVE